ncbi:uncharacterized protein PITG_09752 [Phytophthora infestans T30-4]|uniref:Uncharacterized protein n=1 Tax=Phytophthora infestans (strain T30-4) TaxID=403677 RepID=D0NCQ6_PHYIT|nr:uncharacterized protein PITG_09752 [Phytophthora infestans T30-4]EEY55770.1 conserved hypothetical protein [Phytophthora infestans T30-4]|eukprot:XP_002903346.1 conserved hypothetical protein [Phytophthora infestans T30-4]
MADDAYYRQVLAQMQSEFTRAVAALEKQAQQEAKDREQALTLEISALKSLLQQEQDYWTRYDEAGKQDRDRLTRQLAEAKAESMQYHEQNKTLRREMKALQRRVETAVATSNSFEQRLMVVVQEKQQSVQEVNTQLAQYKKRLQEKRAQNKYLTEALVRLQEQRQSADESSKPTKDTNTTMTNIQTTDEQRRRKRELTLPEELKPASVTYKSKRMTSSRAGTSPTSSSPEISPRSARSAPYKRPLSVATTTPTTSDNNSFNSSGSLRSLRSLRHVTGRRISSRSNSDSDNIDVSPRTNATRTSATGRLERELNGLRRKLDSCIADATKRW